MPAQRLAAVEVAAGLRTVGVDGAEEGGGIESDAGAVAALVHAAHARVLGDEFRGNNVTGPQLDHKVAAASATGARGKIGMGVDEASGPHGPGIATYLARTQCHLVGDRWIGTVPVFGDTG